MGSRLVLWDIDHTLIETRGVGSQVYAEAFAKVTGRQLDKMPELAGRTEPVIFRDALRVNGVEASQDLYEKFAAEQAQGYADHLDELCRRGRALPGAREALAALAERDDVTQSVLTGNTRPSAEIKLRAFGLDRYINFDIGAYGTDDDTRANLVDIARQRAEETHAQDYADGQTILIGDTSNDVAAALGSNARIVAVATGKRYNRGPSPSRSRHSASRPNRHDRSHHRSPAGHRMTFAQSPNANLDAMIRQARYLLFAFDGPLRSTGRGDRTNEASDTAPPAPYIHDVLAACHESGRFAVVICTAPSAEVLAYLDAHDLFTRVTLIAASIGDAITEQGVGAARRRARTRPRRACGLAAGPAAARRAWRLADSVSTGAGQLSAALSLGKPLRGLGLASGRATQQERAKYRRSAYSRCRQFLRCGASRSTLSRGHGPERF